MRSTFRLSLVLLVAVLVAACRSATETTTTSLQAKVEERLRSAVENTERPDAPASGQDAVRRALRQFYQESDYALAWSTADGVRPEAQALLTLLRQAEDEETGAAAYDTAALGQALRGLGRAGQDPHAARTRFDLLLSSAALRHAEALQAVPTAADSAAAAQQLAGVLNTVRTQGVATAFAPLLLRARLEDGLRGQRSGDRRVADALGRFYERVQYVPAWSTDGRVHPEADSLLRLLREAGTAGLDPASYHVDTLAYALRQARAAEAAPEPLVRLDLLLSSAALHYASDLYGGRVPPGEAGPDAINPDSSEATEVHPDSVLQAWPTRDRNLDLVDVLAAARQDGPRAAFESLHPPHDEYQHLRAALTSYRAVAEQGGWPTLPAEAVLAPGDRSAHVASLHQRLMLTGDLEAPAARADSTYDEALQEAVRHFQRRHGLEADGIAGPSTIAALNVPVETRIRQIEHNLERWRWVPADFGDRYLLVNLPEYKLRFFDEGTLVDEMNVVVGEEYDSLATPVFSDQMRYVVFQPYWNVPTGIAANKLLPEVRQDARYLLEQGYEIVDRFDPEDARIFAPDTVLLADTTQTDTVLVTKADTAVVVDTTLYAKVEAGELFMRQQAGPRNALGLVKFMFPNRYAIYLHDSPAEHLFDKDKRTFSHGCVRVERPADLAAFVLQEQEAWDRPRIDSTLHHGDWERVDLETPLPVYILYWTVFPDQDGVLHFREDIYQHDAALAKALRDRRDAPSV